MFEKKSQEEIDKMTAEQYEAYVVAKETHEAGLRQKEIADAIAEATKNNASKEQIEALETQNKAIVKELEAFGLRMKAINEKPSNLTTEKTDLEKFISRENKKDAGWEATTVKAAALMTTANVIPNVASGFNQLFGNYIDPVIHSAPKQDVFIMGLVDTQMAPGSESVWYVERVNEDGDAAFIAEGALKPLVDGDYQERKVDMKEVAERWKMTKRLINHAPSVVGDFRTHADELIRLKMDSGVLTGDGTGNNLSGIAALAAPFVVPTQLANFYPSATIFDAIMAVATYVRLNNFKGQLTCVLNTVWKAKFFGNKEATTNNYIMPSFVAPDGTSVGDVMVVFENGMDADSILLGDLKRFKVRIAEDVEYAEGYENDDFSKNLVSRKLESFLACYLPANYAGAIIYDDIATVLTAIEVAP